MTKLELGRPLAGNEEKVDVGSLLSDQAEGIDASGRPGFLGGDQFSVREAGFEDLCGDRMRGDEDLLVALIRFAKGDHGQVDSPRNQQAGDEHAEGDVPIGPRVDVVGQRAL